MARGSDAGLDFSNRTDTVQRALVRAFGLFRRVMTPYFARFGVSGGLWGVLRVLHRAHEAGEPILRQSQVSERLLIQPPSVTGAIEKLCRMGLVERRVSARDQRAREVSLTPRGLRRIERVLGGLRPQQKRVTAGLTRSEQQTLHVLLDRWAEHLLEMLERGEPVGDDEAPPARRNST